MLRVSSYRRLFEEERWGRGHGSALMCGGQYRASARGGAAVCEFEEPDFEAARTLNREAVSRFVKERTLIAALNDRLAFLIETARCLEEENESLEAQILELEERLGSQEMAVTSAAAPPDLSLEAVVERLRREKEEIMCDTARLKEELVLLQTRHEEAAKQRTVMELERDDVAMEVDAITTECLALREQVAIYEQQLARMQKEHETTVETLVEPGDGVPMVTLKFPTPDVTPAILDIKEYYYQLAETLKYETRAAVAVALRDRKPGEVVKVPGAKVTDVSKVTDIAELKNLIAELQRELAELEQRGRELEAEIEGRRAAHLEEISELECCVADLEEARAELQAQMKEQCADYEELLSQKMALDIEITAYRGLVEEEEDRLCYL
ncbi:hypothetical protein MATL_G00172260 [Megalops atlanticus]|uniref:IF rod domain-containing protein n=1 Tax=Megalops atlanticus TaxID=7932 RepID=A0A9D3T796_MEGAT|nr:hypothetical protein MATL_G00172260 [Megalops atlanticus]